MRKETKRKCHPTRAQGREGSLPANQGPKEVENKAKPKLKHLNSVQHHHGPSPGDHKRQSNKIGLKVAHLGSGCTPQAQPSLVGTYRHAQHWC